MCLYFTYEEHGTTDLLKFVMELDLAAEIEPRPLQCKFSEILEHQPTLLGGGNGANRATSTIMDSVSHFVKDLTM